MIATAKHFVGDGGTDKGKDQGDNLSTPQQLRDIHGAGYPPAVEAGVQAVMASYSRALGEKMHGNRELLTDRLKGDMAFNGLVVGDWNGHGQVPGCTNTSCAAVDQRRASTSSWRPTAGRGFTKARWRRRGRARFRRRGWTMPFAASCA